VEALLALGHDVLDPSYLGDTELLARIESVIVLDSHRSELERVAHVLLPVRVAAEKDGTLTNHAGRVQRVVPAVEPAFEAYSEGEVLARLGRALGLAGFEEKWDAAAVLRDLVAHHPTLAVAES
jgi:NADH dehydrogenase/NADH:ubiquinone oxidoreductase subunit G